MFIFNFLTLRKTKKIPNKSISVTSYYKVFLPTYSAKTRKGDLPKKERLKA